MKAGPGWAPAHVLMVVENASAPTDRRVWKEARSLHGAGYRVTVISPAGRARDSAPREMLEGIDIRRFPAKEAGRRGARGYLGEFAHALAQIRRLARDVASGVHVDVIHLCNPPDVLYLAVHSLRRRGAAVVFDHHDLVPELFEARFGHTGGVLYRAARIAERRTFAVADVVLSPNESYRQIAIHRGRKRPEDVFVVRMAPDPERFRPVEPDPSLREGKRFLLAYAGTMGPQDGVDRALYALRRLADRRADWAAVFAGSGDAAEGIESLSRELGLDGVVRFVGHLGDTELVTLLGSADVCLSPEPPNALNEASTMIKVVEYMGMGRPLVAYDLRETRVSAGEAAVYAAAADASSFADAIERLLDDEALRARLGAIGRERVLGELSWARSEAALLDAYARLRPP